MSECIQVKTSYPQEWATYEHLHAIACNGDVSAYAAHALEALGFARWEQHQHSEVLRLTKAGEVLHSALQAVEKAKDRINEAPANTGPMVITWGRCMAGRDGTDGWQLYPKSKDWLAVIAEPGIDVEQGGVYVGSLWCGSAPIEQDTFSSAGVAATHIVGWLNDRGWLDGLTVDMAPFEAKPAAVEEKPAYVARWRKCETFEGWQLITSAPAMQVLATIVSMGTPGRSVYRSAVGWQKYESVSAITCAVMAEDRIRLNGRGLLCGPIDRSALEGL